MRHMVDGRKFGINTSHRLARFKTMSNQLIQNEFLVTTVQKAKELRRVVDRLITLGKKSSLHSKRQIFDRTRDRETVAKLCGVLASRYSQRPGGYTRILRMDATRWGDGAEMALIELVDRPVVEKKKKLSKASKKAETAAVDQIVHDEHHDHDGHTHDHGAGHGGEKHSLLSGRKGLLGKVTGLSSRAKGQAGTGVRKTPTKSGGGRSGGSS